MTICERTVILSDTHLGRPGSRVRSADSLRPLWADAKKLIVNGDLAELNDVVHRGDAARHVLRLQGLCDADGVHLCLLSGNHDPLITDRRYLRLGGGEIFITHGDILHSAISPWNTDAHRLKKLHEDALASLDASAQNHFESRLEAAQYASHFKWDELAEKTEPPRSWFQRKLGTAANITRVLWYWYTLPRLAAEFASRYVPESRFFIFGHIHRAGIWRHDGRIIINTGAYQFPAKPHVVVIEGDRLAVWPVLYRNQTFVFGRRPMAQFVLAQLPHS